jgi:hypothetical protein
VNQTKLMSRKLDLARRGIRPDELGPEEIGAALRVKWSSNLEHLVDAADVTELRNATKRPNTPVDRRLRKCVARLRWIPELLPGRKGQQ